MGGHELLLDIKGNTTMQSTIDRVDAIESSSFGKKQWHSATADAIINILTSLNI
jgi:hypothetical protein